MNNERVTFDEVWEKLKSEDKTGVFERAEKIAAVEGEALEYAYDQGFKNGYELGKKEGKNERPTGKWITDRQPDKNGTYLCVFTVKGSNIYFRDILSYATDLYEVCKFDFYDYRYKKKTDRAGWYDLDSEYGYIHYADDEVVAWMELPELPEPYKEADNE